tara:strand:+ start:68 stop:373 length:306 start_codon:yes stop_codon:yes gene_type:complete
MKYFVYLFIIIFNFTISQGFNSGPPKINIKYKNFRKAAGVALAVSFVPYFLDDDIKPSYYKDGLTREEIKIKRKHAELNLYLNGDSKYLNNVFPDFDVKIN